MSTLKVNNVQDLGADAVVTNGVLVKSAFPAGTILQVVSTAKTDTFTTTSNSFTTVTGMSVTITPSSATSKIMIIAQLSYGGAHSSGQGTTYGAWKVTRAGTDIYLGDAASARLRGIFGGTTVTSTAQLSPSGSIVYVDSPAVATAVTYQVETRASAGQTVSLNRSGGDDDDVYSVRGASSITVMEVAG